MSEKMIQKQIIRKAIETPAFSKEILPKIPLAAFDENDRYKEIMGVIQKYYQTNRDILTEDTLLTLLEAKLDRLKKKQEDQQKYFSAVNEVYDIKNSKDNSLLDENIEKYIKKHMRMEVITQAAMNLDNEKEMSKLDVRIREIELLDVNAKSQEIINILDDTEAKRQALHSIHTNTLQTGFAEIDRLGGIGKGELGLIVAASGTGKTMILTNLATNYTRRKQNVLFIALEELQNRMILRFEQAMLRQTKAQIMTNGALNEDHFNKMQDIYKTKREQLGNLFFARYSPRTVTPAKIEQLISDVMIRQGVRIDVVVIDYPELLRNPNETGNEAKDGGELFEEIRRIAQDFNVAMWTAAQMNRSAYNALIRTSEHMEGAHRKKNACELVLTVNQTPEEYDAGFVRLYADKVRNIPEGPFDKMLGFRVIGSAMTVRDYHKGEMEDHKMVLAAADERLEGEIKGKKRSKTDNTPPPDFTNEINQSIQRNRGQ